MSSRPTYFEPIRRRAAERWNQLEQDPELAAPWHQLFKQVQSPRHIISELLQNADDAGATEASVRIEGGTFVFEHNGEDFAADHFASLCRFGYSNKRALHTIGFRGIGFKSTFSLGDRVELYTPTLSVAFNRQRFTEPEWIASSLETSGRTCVRVAIADQNRQREVEKNLTEWLKSPISLLFFKSIRRMHFGEHEVHWESLGVGPVPESERMALADNKEEPCLLVRSGPEAFPTDALEEIRQERMLGTEEEGDFPPCRVEIVLGTRGRLYVVLPTGVETELPFACNAPFIQDPARLKIKDPETSPTNRWLLERAGKLAASTMLHWLQGTEASLAERSRAYALFPDVDREASSLEGLCGSLVEEAFDDALGEQAFLLTEQGELVPKDRGVFVPDVILEVWPADQAATLLDRRLSSVLYRGIAEEDRNKLIRWGVADEVTKLQLLGILQEKYLPKPKSWRQLLRLWTYLAPEITGYQFGVRSKNLRIAPVQGKDVLYAASEVVRLGEQKLLQSEADWDFLARHLLVLNKNWPRFLAERRRGAEGDEDGDDDAADDTSAGYAVLKKLELADTSDVNKVIEQVATEFFAEDEVPDRECVQIAQIAAKLNVNVGKWFRYITCDGYLRPTTDGILVDEDGKLEELLPKEERASRLLHPDYKKAFTSCSREEWSRWISSGRAGLLTMPPLVSTSSTVFGRDAVRREAKKRDVQGELGFPFVTHQFLVEDWDFEAVYWRHWEAAAGEDGRVWTRLLHRILSQRESYWSRSKSARLLQVATTGNTRAVTYSSVTPSWVLKLRSLPCLPDTRGFARKPEDLLRRTPETESLMDVEPFVHGLVDRETSRPLLDLLGVRKTPTGPDRLLDCLRALAKAEKPPVHEVEKWYRRLDQMVDTCSTADLSKIRQVLRSEKLILTHDGAWATTAAVFLASDDDDFPDAAVIRPAVADLTLWRKVGVADRPTADLAVGWLKSLPSGSAVPQEDAKRVRSLMIRYPLRVWEESEHWLNLAGEWAPTSNLAYAVTMQSLVPYQHLHPWVRQQTADLRRLPGEVTANPPFSALTPLAAQIEERLKEDPLFGEQAAHKDWLRTIGKELSRVELDSEEETSRVRSLAEQLARTGWLETPGLEVIPYIDGKPAGTPRSADVMWLGGTLYVEPQPKAKLARRIPEEISKPFAPTDLKAVIAYCFERSAEDVREYLEENFSLVAVAAPPEPIVITDKGGQASDDSPTNSTPVDGDLGKPNQPANDDDERQEPDDQESDDERTEDGGSEQSPGENIGLPPPKPRPLSRPQKPSIMERFAKAQGFRKVGEDRFLHQNGNWIGKADGTRFPWEQRTAGGELVRYYWPKEHCLESEPLVIDSDIWDLIDQHSTTYALILCNIQGEPIEVPGDRLRTMREEGDLILYPATYRLVHSNDRHP